MTNHGEDLVEVLQAQARIRPDDIAFTFLVDGDENEANLTFGELDRRARDIGAFLQARGKQGLPRWDAKGSYRDIGSFLKARGKPQERIVLLYGPGLDYIVAFFGCLYGGAIAVTAYPPDPMRLARTLPRLEAIIADCDPGFVLTTEAILGMGEMIFDLAPSLRERSWVATDTLPSSDAWTQPTLGPSALAFIQYTSGSTGTPKGVMLTHGNLLANEETLRTWLQITSSDVFVGWLPLFHDMGLMAHVILPIYAGCRSVVMSPTDFLARPFRWLKAMSRYRATFCAAPNFAFDLCSRKVTAEERATLDLSSWRVAINGAEPVRADTLERFARLFAPQGLMPSVAHPGYGLAEATLVVSGKLPSSALPVVAHFDSAMLEKRRVIEVPPNAPSARALVACGPALDQRLEIVEPDTRVPCQPGQIGEIWVSGASIGQGYWNRPEETERTFRARLASGSENETFLRTGDLGFIHEGQLVIAGRLKDLIIVRGRNYYPQDIERTVEESYPSLRKGCCAAFANTVNGEERLVVVVEVERRYRPDRRLSSRPPLTSDRRASGDRRKSLPPELGQIDGEGVVPFLPESVIASIRSAVSELHELQVEAVVLLKARSIPKTSSGKIQRAACKAGYLDGTLEELARSALIAAPALGRPTFDAAAFAGATANARQTIAENYLRKVIAAAIRLPIEKVSADQIVTHLGIDSLGVIEISDEVEATTGVKLDTVDLLRDLTITQLAEGIANGKGQTRRPIPKLTPRKPGQPVPLSFPQELFWRWEEKHPGTPTWNMTAAVRITGPLSVSALEQAITEVVRRHESLRATFVLERESPRQIFLPPSAMPLPQADLRAVPEADLPAAIARAAREQQKELFSFSSNAGPAPLLRMRLLHTKATEHVLVFTMHHLISDAGSTATFLNEVGALHASFSAGAPSPLPELPVSYGDFAAWQHEWLNADALAPLAAYWDTQLAGATPFSWPSDAGASAPLVGHPVPCFLPRPILEALQARASAEGATLAMLLMTVLKVCLRRWGGMDDLVVGLQGSARRQSAALTLLIGNFNDTLAVRSTYSGLVTLREALARERAAVLAGYEHIDFPVGLAVHSESAFDSPLLRVWINIRPTSAASQARVPDGHLSFVPIHAPGPATAWQPGLRFVVTEVPEGLSGVLLFCSHSLDEKTAAGLGAELRAKLEAWAADPDATI